MAGRGVWPKGVLGGLLLGAALAGRLPAQDAGEQVWIEVEALPTLGRAQTAAEGYASQIDDVEGYYLGSGLYGVAIGPYDEAEAEAVMARLAADGIVPGEAFLSDGSRFRERFWPVGAAAANPPVTEPDAVPLPEDEPPVAEAPPVSYPPETPEQALASEARLSQGEREQIQVALEWAGVYDGGIDGDFGRGTRAAMAAWQVSSGREGTGVLTTAERAELMAAYNGVLASLDLQVLADAEAGIEVKAPAALLGEPVREPPFLRYEAGDGSGAQLLLISQPGDADALFGLYEILQAPGDVPPEGPRERGESSFVIEGRDATRLAHVEASLEGGEIKGFALLWPASDAARFSRLLPEMRASFRRSPGVLDPGLAAAAPEAAVDLVSGLEVRRAQGTASGFFVDGEGTVATVASAVEGCGRVTLGAGLEARVAHLDEALGLALLQPVEPLAPAAVAGFRARAPFPGDDVAVAGFPYGDTLVRPVLTFGTVAGSGGLGGEGGLRRLDLATRPGDAGGPVLDEAGAVVGMLLAPPKGQALPGAASLALGGEVIVDALQRAGIPAAAAPNGVPLEPEQLARERAGLAVLVSCW